MTESGISRLLPSPFHGTATRPSYVLALQASDDPDPAAIRPLAPGTEEEQRDARPAADRPTTAAGRGRSAAAAARARAATDRGQGVRGVPHRSAHPRRRAGAA